MKTIDARATGTWAIRLQRRWRVVKKKKLVEPLSRVNLRKMRNLHTRTTTANGDISKPAVLWNAPMNLENLHIIIVQELIF